MLPITQDDRFRLPKKSYDSQYAQLYYCRLQRMQPGLLKRTEKEWPGVRGKPRQLPTTSFILV